MMTLEEIKVRIVNDTGIPAHLLTGSTPAAVIEQAQTLLEIKSTTAAKAPRSTAEQFAEWFNSQTGQESRPADPALAALADIAEEVRVSSGGYPIVRDGGEAAEMRQNDPRPARDKFAEWFYKETAFDPAKGPDGWKQII